MEFKLTLTKDEMSELRLALSYRGHSSLKEKVNNIYWDTVQGDE